MLAEFTEGLSNDIREAIERRRDVLTRSVRWHFENSVQPASELLSLGWTVELASRLAALNAIEFHLMAPLRVSIRIRHDTGIGTEMPIRHGTRTVFDRRYIRNVQGLLGLWDGMLRAQRVPSDVLFAQDGEEFLFALRRAQISDER
jgi:hypothetical protein